MEGDDGSELRSECATAVAAGPDPLTADELAFQRYTLTDQLDDPIGGGSTGVVDAAAIDVWRGTADGALAGEPEMLVVLADEVLEQVGGRLWSGFRQAASLPG